MRGVRDAAAVGVRPGPRRGGGLGCPGLLGDAVTPAIRVTGLRYAYPDGHTALRGIDLDVAAGERVALLGPNGAGKTTLMLHLNGVLSAPQGTVEISGTTLSRSTLR